MGSAESIVAGATSVPLIEKTIGAYLDAHYVAGVSVVAAAGAVEHERIVEQAERLFGRFGARPAPASQAITAGRFQPAVNQYRPPRRRWA